MNEQLCRTCLTKMDLRESIFQIVAVIDEEDVSLVEMLDTCTGIKATKNDKISLSICNICINDIIKSYTFRKMCWNSQKYLQKTLEGDSIAEAIAERFEEDLLTVGILDADEEYAINNEDVLESRDTIVEVNVLNDKKKTNQYNETNEEKINTDSNEMNGGDLNFQNTISDQYIVYLDDGPLYKSSIKCKLCDKVYRRRFLIDNHLFIKHNIQLKHMFPCTQCSKSFQRMGNLHEHIARDHPVKEPGISSSKEEILNPSEHDYYEYLDNNKPLSTSSVICKLCGRILSQRVLMKRHLRQIHGLNVTRGFKCTLCNKLFYNMLSLNRHIEHIHTNNESDINIDSNFKCSHCHKSYDKESHLNRHIKNVHENDKKCPSARPHICEYCGKELKNRLNYTEHIRRHTGEKPFKCELCDYRAVSAVYIRVHMRMHMDQRPFKCEMCDKAFRTASYRAVHRRTHFDETPFECVVCSKGFKKRSSLNDHMLIHNPDKHVECQHCGKRFARKYDLMTHIKQHTGEKPHTCEYCGKGFIQKHCWRTHLKNHHNK